MEKFSHFCVFILKNVPNVSLPHGGINILVSFYELHIQISVVGSTVTGRNLPKSKQED